MWVRGASGFTTEKQLFDTRFDGLSPYACVRAVGQADVQATLAFARRYGLKVALRSGGHSYVGASAATNTIVLDMRGMGWSPTLSGTNATVYGGTTLYPVKASLATHGRAIPTGTCPTVGTSGLTVGGGLGIESRTYGLTCDRVSSMTVVIPNGTALRVSATHNADLFWLLRGGGGGNAAVVTGFTFLTHAATSKGSFRLTFPASAGVKVLTGWANWMHSTYNSRWSNLHLTSTGTGSLTISIVGVTNVGDERSAAASLISAIGASASSASYAERSYMDTTRYFGGGTTSARQPFSAGSDIIGAMSTNAAGAILGAVKSGPSGYTAILDPLTGAVSTPLNTATAFPWRDHICSIQWYVGGSNYSSAASWIARAHADVRSYSSGGYVNYLEAGTTMARYVGGNHSRWLAVRQAYDPTGVLSAAIAP
ncbi:FAD-binding oxidoreductase [Calidifontibacter terrae]